MSASGQKPHEISALMVARAAIHALCIERGSTDGYRDVFETINKALPAASAGSQEPAPADDLQDRYDAAVDALTAIRDHGKTDEFPCHAIFKGDCEDTMRETARATLAWLASGVTEKGDGQ
jgi:hypothetical protein